jgi:hypothetical protein
MSIKSYKSCLITQTELGFLIEFSSGNKVLIKDAKSFLDCFGWIDRQIAHLAIQKALGGK